MKNEILRFYRAKRFKIIVNEIKKIDLSFKTTPKDYGMSKKRNFKKVRK